MNLAEAVPYEDLQPLFNTSAKKVGTRIGVMLALGVLLKNGLVRDSEINAFIESGLNDSDKILAEAAQALENL